MHYLHEITRDDNDFEYPEVWTEYRLSKTIDIPEYQDCIDLWERKDEIFVSGKLRPSFIERLKELGVEKLFYVPEGSGKLPMVFVVKQLGETNHEH